MLSQPKNAAVMQSERVVRDLGGHERLFYLYSREHPRHFCIVGELIGPFDETALCLALNAVRLRHPHLQVAIDDDDDGPHFIEDFHPLFVDVHFGSTSAPWEGIVEAELAKPFAAFPGPLIRINIVHGTDDPDRWMVILTFHHAIADGLSGVTFLNDLVSALNGVTLPVTSQRPPVERLVAKALDRPLEVQPSAAERAILKGIARRPLWRDFDGDRPKVHSARLPSLFTSIVVSKCREQKTTVHGALCAALTMANAPAHASDTYSIASPINIRALAKIDRSEIGLFVTASVIPFRMSPELGFWDIARFFSDTLSSKRSADGIMLSLERIESALPQMSTSDMACGIVGSSNYDAVLSNLGRLEIPGDDIGGTKLTGVWGPIVLGRIRNERMIGAATIGDRLHLTEVTPAHMPQCLKQMMAAIRKACVDFESFI